MYRDPGGYHKIVVKTSWMRVALAKTKIDPEDTPEEQDHLKGQAQRQMLDTSSLSQSDQLLIATNIESMSVYSSPPS